MRFQLIGHSLGGQFVGIVARSLNKLSNGKEKLFSIISLDPARIEIEFKHFFYSISAQDANFVQIYHSNPLQMAVNDSAGTVDIWFNDPLKVQPGCENETGEVQPSNKCSHLRTITFWAEMITGKRPFHAVRSNSWRQFTEHKFNDKIILGPKIRLTARGNYYLQTNCVEPFSRGIPGVIYNENLSCISKRI